MQLKRALPLLILLVLLVRDGDLFAASPSAPETWAQGTVSPALQLPRTILEKQKPSSVTAPRPLREEMQPVVVSHLPAEDDPGAEEGDAEENEDALALVDPEAIEEARILTEEEATPPEDEGATVEVTELQFDFPVVENQKVQYYIDYFTGPGRNAFSRWLERTTRYLPYMQEVFAEQGLPRDLVYLSIVESGLNPTAYSWAHASGPWQFIPSTGRIFGLEADYWWDERRDFEKSTQAAARFLKELYGLFNGDWYLAVAAYNAGPGAVGRAVERSGSTDFWTLAHNAYLPEETRNYIPKLLAVLLIAKQPEKYGFTDTAYLEPIACDKVTVEGPIDLAVIARLADSSYGEIKALNPELKRWCTPPQLESYQVNLPVGTRENVLTAYAELPAAERRNYQVHKLAKGETLKGLARQYRLSVDEILRANSLTTSKTIKAGRNLVIPLRTGVAAIPREDLFDDPVVIKTAKSKTYKVKKGDTLSKIARNSGVSLAQLKNWNRLTGRSRLQIGQVLSVGPGKKSPRPLTATAKASKKKGGAQVVKKTAASAGNKIVYTVKKGDTVYKIARQYAVKPAQVLAWNGLGNVHTLQPGQNLTLRVQGRKGG
jgi:membrane-bound lytic murein transglycosylase D